MEALGARRLDISTQFLVESLILSTLGGIAGTGLGLTTVEMVALLTPLPATIGYITVLVTVMISGTIGLTFGVLPAKRAARLDPITALRSL